MVSSLSNCDRNRSCEGNIRNALVLDMMLNRSPDTAKVRTKMLYASSKDRIKRELDGIQVELQATDPSEMSWDTLKARAF